MPTFSLKKSSLSNVSVSSSSVERVGKNLVVVLLAINVLITVALVSMKFHSWGEPVGRAYTYLDSDYPNSLPLIPDQVSLSFERSIHYPINDSSTAISYPLVSSSSDWETLYPAGHGFVRLGPQYRALALSVYHQLHCLDMLRNSVGSGRWTSHTVHCLSYLRQGAMCAGDLHLERVFEEEGEEDREGARYGVWEGMHRCRDWTAVFEEEERLHAKWKEWKKGKNTTTMSIVS